MEQALLQPADQFDSLLKRLPDDLDLDALARQTTAIERDRKGISGTTLLRLALARGPGGLSLSATAEERASGALSVITVDDLAAANPVYLVTRKGGYLSPAAKALAGILRDAGLAN